jgi:hypothetical protein
MLSLSTILIIDFRIVPTVLLFLELFQQCCIFVSHFITSVNRLNEYNSFL